MMRWLLALVFLIPHWIHAEERLGRLFLTPAERSHLDSLRQTSKPPLGVIRIDATEAVYGESAPAHPAAAVTVQGYVRRSDGKGTVWVNRQPLSETSVQGNMGVGRLGRADGRVRLKLSGSDVEVALKAGQTYDPVTGAVVESARGLPDAGQSQVFSPEERPGKPLAPVSVVPKKP